MQDKTHNFVDLGLTAIPESAYPIRVNVQLARKTVKGYRRWLPIFGEIDAIPEEWNTPKPGYLVIYGGRPRLCNVADKPWGWTASWEVGRSGEYKIDHMLITHRDTGEKLFAMYGLKWDYPEKSMVADSMIHVSLAS